MKNTSPLDSFCNIISENERAQITGRSIRTLQEHRKSGTAPAWLSFNGTVFYSIEHLPPEERSLAREIVAARRVNHAGRIVNGPMPWPAEDRP